MTRNLPEPSPELTAAKESQRWVFAAAAEILRRIDLHRLTGESHLTIVSNEGGVRAVLMGSSKENFKKPS